MKPKTRFRPKHQECPAMLGEEKWLKHLVKVFAQVEPLVRNGNPFIGRK